MRSQLKAVTFTQAIRCYRGTMTTSISRESQHQKNFILQVDTDNRLLTITTALDKEWNMIVPLEQVVTMQLEAPVVAKEVIPPVATKPVKKKVVTAKA